APRKPADTRRLPSRVSDRSRVSFRELLLLVFCLALGWLVGRLPRLPQGLASSLNWWVLNIALPALVLELIPRVRFDPQLWFLPVSMWLVFAGAWVIFATLGARLGWSRARIGGVVLAAGLGNTALVGFPLIEALRGREGLGLAVITDQLGGVIALATGAITVAAVYSGSRPEAKVIAQRILLFPAFNAMIVGFVVGMLGGWPEELNAVFLRLGSTLTPIALFSIGLQLRLQLDRARIGATVLALSWKLALAPLMIYGLGIATGIQGAVFA